jgi:hypothetical protein
MESMPVNRWNPEVWRVRVSRRGLAESDVVDGGQDLRHVFGDDIRIARRQVHERHDAEGQEAL